MIVITKKAHISMIYEQSIIERNPWWVTGKVPEVLHGIRHTEYLEKIGERLKDRTPMVKIRLFVSMVIHILVFNTESTSIDFKGV